MPELRVLLVPVGLDLYAVPTDSVREVVRASRVTALPTAPAPILGLFNLRGEIVPLLDTGAMVGLGRMPDWSFVVVVRSSLGPAGLAATALPEPVAFGDPVGSSEAPATAGAYAVGRRLAVLLNVEELLDGARLGSDHPPDKSLPPRLPAPLFGEPARLAQPSMPSAG